MPPTSLSRRATAWVAFPGRSLPPNDTFIAGDDPTINREPKENQPGPGAYPMLARPIQVGCQKIVGGGCSAGTRCVADLPSSGRTNRRGPPPELIIAGFAA